MPFAPQIGNFNVVERDGPLGLRNDDDESPPVSNKNAFELLRVIVTVALCDPEVAQPGFVFGGRTWLPKRPHDS
jgi:hypothetical protein